MLTFFYILSGLAIGLILGLLSVALYRAHQRRTGKVHNKGFTFLDKVSKIQSDSRILNSSHSSHASQEYASRSQDDD